MAKLFIAKEHTRYCGLVRGPHVRLIRVSCIRKCLNPLNTELNPNCHLLALLGAHHILHVGRIRVNYCVIFAVYAQVTHLAADGTMQRVGPRVGDT